MTVVMTTTAPITVIIPAFNPGRFLTDALSSVAAQTVVPARVLIIDDGSNPPIAAPTRCGEIPVDCLRQTNAGQAAARNRALELASTELVAFLDADDIWHPRKLEWQIAALATAPDAGCVGCRAVLVDAERRFIGRGPGTFAGGFERLARPEFINLAAEAVLVPSMVLMRRAAAQATAPFNSAFQPIEDLVFFDRYLAGARTCLMVDLPLLQRRLHGSNLTFRFRDMLRSYLRWAETWVEPECGVSVAEALRARALEVTGLSALAAGQSGAARSLLRQACIRIRRPKTLAAFAFACMGPAVAAPFRYLRHQHAGTTAHQQWHAVTAPSANLRAPTAPGR